MQRNPNLERTSLTKLDEPLFPVFEDAITPLKKGDRKEKGDISLTGCAQPLVLDVLPWPTKYSNASHLLFGMSTSMERLVVSIPYLQRWIAFTRSRLVVVITGREEETVGRKEMRELESHVRGMGIKATLVKPLKNKDRMEGRFFSLVKVLWKHRDECTKWAVITDDDTFFPTMT